MDGYELWKLKQLAYGDGSQEESFSKSLLTPENFMDFYNKGWEYEDNGACVVFTGKQFVCLKNAKDGQQGHMFSFARIHRAMVDNDDVNITMSDAAKIVSRQDKHYLTLTFEVEKGKRGPMYKCIRVFYRGPLSREEFASFQAFYDQFSEIIKKCGFNLWVNDVNKNEEIEIHDIDTLRDFLESTIDDEKVPYVAPVGEKIVGVSNGLTIEEQIR